MKIRRRNFVQMLSLSPLAFLLPKVSARPRSGVAGETRRLLKERLWEEKPREVQMAYKGFTLRWSGWIGDINRPRYCGHWVGVDKETDMLVYASYPGKEGQFVRGDAFDITQVSPQIEITLETPEATKNYAQYECLDRLHRVIDDLRPGLVRVDPIFPPRSYYIS